MAQAAGGAVGAAPAPAAPAVPLLPVRNILRNLCAANAVRIRDAYLTRGGWEGWLQVELALALSAAAPIGVNVRREDGNYYAGANRADITIDYGAGLPKVVIELKCESLWQQAAPATHLSARFGADIAKRGGLVVPAPTFMAFAVTATAQCFAFDMIPAMSPGTPFAPAGPLHVYAGNLTQVIASNGPVYKIGIFRFL